MKKTDSIAVELKNNDNDLMLQKYKTALKKVQFINEIKSHLGEEIKSNPNKVKIIKKSTGQKIKDFLIKLFTKF